MKKYYILTIFLIWISCSYGQKSVLNNDFLYEDGIFYSYDEFKENKAAKIDSNMLALQVNAEESLILIDSSSLEILLRNQKKDKIWGLCYMGIPYIKTEETNGPYIYFSKLHVIGKICYYYYKAFREKEVWMQVHNPYSGELIGRKSIKNKELVFVEHIFKHEDGISFSFNYENLFSLSSDDVGLKKSMLELKIDEKQTKLFKTLLIYNDRNPIYLSK